MQNPYRPSTTTTDEPIARHEQQKPKRWVFWLIVVGCVIACGMAFRLAFADGLRSVGDPSGKGIATGLGGLFGLTVAAFFWLILRTLHR